MKATTSKFPATMRSFLAQPIVLFGTLYVVALTSSLLGMEIAAWVTTFFLLLYYFADLMCSQHQFKIHTLGVELPLVGLVVIVFTGLYVNRIDHNDFVAAVSGIRNLLLIYIFSYVLHIIKNLNRTIAIMLVCATVVAGYAVFQHFTGVDVLHPNQLLPARPDGRFFASLGLFTSPLKFGYAYMMFLCIPWAALLLCERRPWWQVTLFVISFAVIFLSLVFTYGRGVWIAVLATLPLMAFFASRKLFFLTMAVLIVGGGIVFKFAPVLREKTQAIFAENPATSESRQKLWQANLEMLHDHPWIGVGFGQNENLSDTYFKKLGIQDGVPSHAHSNYVEALATTGVLGFAAYMLFILAFILMTSRLFATIPTTHYWHRVFALGALGAQLAFHIGGLTQWTFGDGEVQHQYFFWLAVVGYMSERYYAHIVPDDHSL